MAKIVVAREAGACFGVERALKMVREYAESHTEEIHTLGPLIHNPIVVAELEELGVGMSDTPKVAPGSTLVLRTHGVTPEVERAAREAGAKVIDATCPFVLKAHRAAERLERDGYQVLVVGEAGHAEVEGTLGHAPSGTVVANAGELDGMDLARKVGIVVQTTQKRENLRQIVAALVGRVAELRVIDTICEATSGHQAACRELAEEADVMIVVGGRNSANTTNLADIARSCCSRTYHIEQASEIMASWLDGAQLIGVTAGASTPASHIEAVCDRLDELAE